MHLRRRTTYPTAPRTKTKLTGGVSMLTAPYNTLYGFATTYIETIMAAGSKPEDFTLLKTPEEVLLVCINPLTQ